MIGARRVDQVTSSLTDVELTADDLARVDELIPAGSVSGDRYPAAAMAQLDSER